MPEEIVWSMRPGIISKFSGPLAAHGKFCIHTGNVVNSWVGWNGWKWITWGDLSCVEEMGPRWVTGGWEAGTIHFTQLESCNWGEKCTSKWKYVKWLSLNGSHSRHRWLIPCPDSNPIHGLLNSSTTWVLHLPARCGHVTQFCPVRWKQSLLQGTFRKAFVFLIFKGLDWAAMSFLFHFPFSCPEYYVMPQDAAAFLKQIMRSQTWEQNPTCKVRAVIDLFIYLKHIYWASNMYI